MQQALDGRPCLVERIALAVRNDVVQCLIGRERIDHVRPEIGQSFFLSHRQ